MNDVYQPSKKKPYRPCVGICLFNKDGKVFVAERIQVKDAWQMPQGGIDKDEDPFDAAMRELKEEIGTNNARYLDRIDPWLYYDLPKFLRKKMWKGKYRGQKQIWYAMLFEGHDDEIYLHGEHAEFTQYQWVDISEIADLIVDFKKDIYLEVAAQFKHLAIPRNDK